MFKNKSKYLTISIILLLLFSLPIQSSFGNMKSTSKLITPNAQEPIDSISLFLNSLSYLENATTSTFGLSSYSTNESLIYYSNIGLSGIGMNLINTLNENAYQNSSINTRLTNLAIGFGDYLIAHTQVDNATHAIWSVSNFDNSVDLSYEYGLSGILQFLSNLYNVTENSTYADYATKLLNTLVDLSSNGNFVFDIDLVFDNEWYPISEFNIYPQKENATFTGIAYGSAGLGYSLVNYLQLVDTANTGLGELLLNKTVNYILSQSITNGSELSILTADNYPGMISNGFANGMAGLGELFIQTSEYYGNSSLLSNAFSIFNWLNGTTSLVPKFDSTWVVNDTRIEDKEIGNYFGIASAYTFFNKIYQFNSSDSMTDFMVSFGITLRKYGIENDNSIRYGERVLGGAVRSYGSTSWSFGSGGIFKVLNQLGNDFNSDTLELIASKSKYYLLTTYKTEGDITTIFDVDTFGFENNPMRGISGNLRFLSSATAGVLDVSLEQYSFIDTELGSSSELLIPLSNIGEASIFVNWSLPAGAFSTELSSITVESGNTYELKVIFSPTEEMEYNGYMNLTHGQIRYRIDFVGIGFDNPTLSVTSPVNGTEFTSYGTHEFKATATDTTGIQSVTMTLLNGNMEKMDTQNMIFEDGEYSNVWNTLNFDNGTYYVIITATDILQHSIELVFQYSMAVYEPPLAEQVLSEGTIYGLIVALVFLVIGAIFLTRRAQSG